MLGIGMPEIIVIFIVALLVFGPKKLPELAKSIGRGMAEFKKATQDLKTSLNMDEEIQEIKQSFDDEMWRTLDEKNRIGVDPYASPQTKMQKLQQIQTEESSLTGREESGILEQKEQHGQDQSMDQGGSKADGKLANKPEICGKGKGEGIGG